MCLVVCSWSVGWLVGWLFDCCLGLRGRSRLSVGGLMAWFVSVLMVLCECWWAVRFVGRCDCLVDGGGVVA